MELKNINTCINCENLIREFVCQKHKQKVEITNFCDSHIYKPAINKDSSCSNCFHFEKTSCTKPEEASHKMVCFDWKIQ
jgi:hypothetical protein